MVYHRFVPHQASWIQGVVINKLSKYAYFFFHFKQTIYDCKTAKYSFSMWLNFTTCLNQWFLTQVRFLSAKFGKLFKLHDTTLAMSSSFHPQTDGQFEALKKCLEQYLRCFTVQNPKS